LYYGTAVFVSVFDSTGNIFLSLLMRYSAQQLTRFPHEYTTQREEALVLIIDYLIR